jgi:Helicase associated domain
MSDLQLERLASLSFRFSLKNIDFEERLLQIAQYKETHGDTRIPVLFAGSNNLGAYCHHMRQQYHQGKLAVSRVAALDALGFDWSMRRRGQNGRSGNSNNNMASASASPGYA